MSIEPYTIYETPYFESSSIDLYNNVYNITTNAKTMIEDITFHNFGCCFISDPIGIRDVMFDISTYIFIKETVEKYYKFKSRASIIFVKVVNDFATTNHIKFLNDIMTGYLQLGIKCNFKISTSIENSFHKSL